MLNAAGLLFGLRCWLAAVLALAVAFAFDLRNPWWAMLTVFITSQPVAGAVASKALYRVTGTLVGVGAALWIVPNLVNAPELMLLAIAAWVGLGLYLSLLRRGPESYAFMLAGYTVAVVGLPQFADPYAIFDTAVARAEEIVVGVVAATLVHGLLFPTTAEHVVLQKLDTALADLRRWIVAALTPETAPVEAARRRRLAADLTELNLLAAHLVFEPLARRDGTDLLRALEQRLTGLLPLLSAIEDRYAALCACGTPAVPIAALIGALRDWVADGDGDAEAAAALIAASRAAMPEARHGAGWAELLTVSLLERIEELVALWRDACTLLRLLRDPAGHPDAGLQALVDRVRRRPLHIDHGLALWSGVAAACGTLAAGAFVWLTHWSEGFIAVTIASVLSCLFATADDPTPMLRRMLNWTLLAIPVALLYAFAILPAIDGFPLLAVALLPLAVPIGAFLLQPQHSLRALAFAIGVSAGMSLQPNYHSDFVAFTVGNLGVVIGTLTALLVMQLIRVIRSEVSARRILGAGWRELERLATDPRPATREDWASRMLDRLGLLLPRLAQADPAEGLHLADALNDLRLGVSIVDLRSTAANLPRRPAARVDRLLAGFAGHARALAGQGLREPDRDLIAQIDRVIAELLQVDDRPLRLHGLAASVGLRRNLFPGAAPYRAAETPA